MSKVISANRLADGIVVYAGQGRAWFERLNEACIFASKEEANAGLSLAQDDVTRNLIVEPCLVDVTQGAGGLRPSTLRETIRAQGPTIDFLPHRRAVTSDTILPHKSPGKHAAKPVLRKAEADDLGAFGRRPREAKSAAGLAGGIAQ